MAAEPPVKRRKLSPTESRSSKPATIEKQNGSGANTFNNNAFYSNASKWNLEQSYENRPRKVEKKRKESTRLPIKTDQGVLQRSRLEEKEEVDDAGSWLESSDEEEQSRQEQDGTPEPEESQMSQREQIIAAKEELARLALLLNQDPEENSSAFKQLSQIGRSKNITVKKLALATQMTVFKDVIPGYRIRALTEKDMAEKVSKEVKQKRTAEQALVRYYQKYVQELSSCAKRGKEGAGLDKIAISCTCSLLLSAPHFNFRSELLQILINKLSHRKVDDQFKKCIETLEKMFADDEDGNASLDAVRTIVQMMKARKWIVNEAVLNTFLQLRLLSEFDFKASATTVDKPTDGGKKLKQKREFRSKKLRKQLKELKAAEKDYQEADAIVSHEERDKKQAETLKIVFATYFKILKAKTPHLTGAVLEGLAKFAHLINQDFFGDLLEVFKELAYNAASHLSQDPDSESESAEGSVSLKTQDPGRTALLCTTTAFTLLSAQDMDKLSLDLSSFTSLLYTLLIPHLALNPDLEFSHKTLRLADPHSTGPEAYVPKINVSTTSTLLIRALTSALSPRNTPPTRLASFTHRLMSLSLQTPEKTSRAILALVAELARSQGKKIRPLWYSEERRGDGRYEPEADVEGCRPYAGSIWEGELLRRHFALGVRDGVGELESVVGDLA